MLLHTCISYILSLATIVCIVPTKATPLGNISRDKRATANGNWTNLALLPHTWQEHTTVALDGYIYVMGGVSSSPTDGSFEPTITDVARYSIANNSWTMIAPMPHPLNHANSVAHDGKIYVLGGLAPGADPLNWLPSNISCVYDPTSGNWTLLPTIPAEFTRGSCAAASWGDEIILAAGLIGTAFEGNFSQPSVDTVTAYNVRNQTWRQLPSLPETRDHDAYAVVGHNFYVIGGRSNGSANVHDTVYAMDLTQMSAGWRSLSKMPTARGGCTAGAINGTIYVFGGEGNPVPGSNGVYPEVEAYDTSTDTWTKLTNMLVPRHGTIAAAVNGGVYIPGGGFKTGNGAVAIFDVFRP